MAKRVSLNLKGAQQLRAKMQGVVDTALMATAIKVRDDARELAPEDTGSLKASIHIVSNTYSDYSDSMANAQELWQRAVAAKRTPKGRQPTPTFYGLPEIKPKEPNEVWVVVGMKYGFYVHIGFPGPPNPYLFQAVTRNKAALGSAIKSALNKLIVETSIAKLEGTP